MTFRKLGGRLPILLALLVSSPAAAQTSVEPPVVNPGARSLALGGAFVALADDATAAYANPSGLVQLLRPEISLELRASSDDREVAASDLSGIGFASFVLPLQRWALAIYGHTLASLDVVADVGIGGDEIVPLSSLTVANLGVSAAYRLSDALDVGLGTAIFSATSTEVRIDTSPIPAYFSTDDTSVELGMIAGVRWILSDGWALGAAYRGGADFRFSSGREVTLPDVLAVGVRWRSAEGQVMVAVEAERLSGLSDQTRLHLGGEWAFLSVKPLIGLRAGVWHDSDGGIGDIQTGADPLAKDGVLHASAGIGAAFKRFQIDLGADFSEHTTIASISAIFTF